MHTWKTYKVVLKKYNELMLQFKRKRVNEVHNIECISLEPKSAKKRFDNIILFFYN